MIAVVQAVVDDERNGHNIDGNHKGMDRVFGFVDVFSDVLGRMSVAKDEFVNEKDARRNQGWQDRSIDGTPTEGCQLEHTEVVGIV